MLVGITGALGAGKDAVGEYLVQHYGFTRLAFADPLKQSAAALFGIDPQKWNEWKNSNSHSIKIVGPSFHGARDLNVFASLTPREFLQRYGTEAHRDVFGYDFWVNATLDKIDPDGRYVITDARFDNEAEAIHNNGGRVFAVIRPGTQVSEHASEQGISYTLTDDDIQNEGTLDDLHANVAHLMWIWFGLEKDQ